MKTNIKKLPGSQVEISVVIPNKDLEKRRKDAEELLTKNVSLDGFRKGKVPKDVALKKVDDMAILEKMANLVIADSYTSILEKNKDIRAIGHPNILITKLGVGSDLEFKLITAVLPEIKIGDYKKIASEEMEKDLNIKIEAKEVDEAIMHLRRMRAQQESMKNMKKGDKPKSLNEFKDGELPEIDDEWVKSLGEFQTVADFRKKLEENMREEKKNREAEKRRIEILDKIIEKSKIEVPEMLINFELEKMLHQMKHDLSMSGMTVDKYLESIKKTRDDLKREWKPNAEKQAKSQMILNHIASLEKINPTNKEMDEEVKKILEQYKNSPEKIDENQVRAYVATILTNKKVFDFLEK